MKYFVTYILKSEYTLGDKLTIKSKEEKEVDGDIFDYLNSTYGDSGWFTFRKESPKVSPKKPKKETPKKETPKKETPKDVQDVPVKEAPKKTVK